MATPTYTATQILNELRIEVIAGLGGKSLAPHADAALEAFYRPKIQKRLDDGGDWDKEKASPKLVARHLGQILAILTVGAEVTAAVAQVGANAIRADENCPAGGGGGLWCF